VTNDTTPAVASEDRSFTVDIGAFGVSYEPVNGEFRIDDGTGGHLAVGFPTMGVLEQETVDTVRVSEQTGAVSASVVGEVGWGAYECTVVVSGDQTVAYDLAVTPTHGEGTPLPSGGAGQLVFRAPDGSAVEEGDSVIRYLDGTPGSNSAAGADDLNQFVFCSAPAALDATVTYLTDFTALSPYYERTGTNMRDTVSSPPGRFGYAVPAPGSLPTGERLPLASGVLALDGGAVPVDEPTAYGPRFVAAVDAVYPHLETPETERVDWPEVTERAASDIASPENLRTYRGVTCPDGDLVTLTSILAPFREYEREFGEDLPHTLIGDAEDAIAQHYDPEYDNGSGREGMVANTLAPHRLTECDAWYFLWPVVQVGECAEAFDSERLREMVLDSAASAVELARALDYVFPMWLNVDACEGDTGDPGATWHGYQYDCTGLYVYLMEQCHSMTGEGWYLDEAEAAADRLLGMGFELPYEFTTSGVVPLAMLRLAELTGDDRYVEGSELALANVLRHSYFFDPEYDHYADRTIFLLTEAMPPDGYVGELFTNNYYANALEELSLTRYLRRYLEAGRDSLSPEARRLVAELLRYKGTSLADSVTPFADPSLVYDGVSPQSGVRANPEWHLPLEPFGVLDPMFSQLGEIEQVTYGSGAYPEMARTQYHRLDEVTLFAETPVAVERQDEFTHRVEPLRPDGRFEACLIGGPESVHDLVVETLGGEEPPTTYDPEKGVYRLTLDGDATYRVRHVVPSVVVEGVSVAPTEVAPGDTVTVDVTVHNTAHDAGVYTAALTVGERRLTRAVPLHPNESRTIQFAPEFDTPGEYEVTPRHHRTSPGQHRQSVVVRER
jgi:plastocyanin